MTEETTQESRLETPIYKLVNKRANTNIMSDDIEKLATALSKAQGGMKNANLNCVNPFFKSKYADLACIIDTVRKPLSDAGLSYVQLPETKDGKVGVTTILMHTSGQWIKSSLFLKTDKDTAQGAGSALTYAKRYSLASIVGIAADLDDDGNAASKEETKPAKVKPAKKENPQERIDKGLKALKVNKKQADTLKAIFAPDVLLKNLLAVASKKMTLQDLFETADRKMEEQQNENN